MLSTGYRAGRFHLLRPPSVSEIHLTPYGQSPDRPRLSPTHISSRSAPVPHLPPLDRSALPQIASPSPRSSARVRLLVALSAKIFSALPCLHTVDRTRPAFACTSSLWDRQRGQFVPFLPECSGLPQDVTSAFPFSLGLSPPSLPCLTSPPAS